MLKLQVNSLIKKNINLQLMPDKMIPFPYEIKVTYSDFCYYGIYCSNKDRHSGSLFFLFNFFISIEIQQINVNIKVV